MNLQRHIPKTASRQKLFRCAFASGVNRPESRAASRVWARRRVKLASGESLYNYFRDYEPSIGRYIESDPIGLKGGLSTYGYTDADPPGATDSLGLWVERCARGLGNKHKPERSPRGNPVRHDYLSVSGEVLSFGPTGSMLLSPGKVGDNEYPTNPQCATICAAKEFDEFVLAAAKDVGAPDYCVFATEGSRMHARGMRNCQTWVDDVLALAKRRYLATVKCPQCFK